MYGLKQVKEINSKTITQEVAAELCSILGLWNHYTDSKYCDKFTIKDKDKTEYTWTNNVKSLITSPDGVSIVNSETSHKFRIWSDGMATCYNNRKDDSEWEHIVRNKKTGHERVETQTLEYHAHQIQYVDKLLELGFFKFDIRDKKLNRIFDNEL